MNTLNCQQCNLSFTLTPGSFGKFCSLSCGSVFNGLLRRTKTISKYESNPKHCNTCNNVLPYSKRKNKFCSHSCSAKTTNLVERKRGPTAKEKAPFTKIKFILCEKTNQYYLNTNPDGSRRRASPYVKTDKEKYYASARFKFNVYHYPDEFDLSLIERYGWYTCPGKKRKNELKNIHGISRDHIISVSYGFANGIDPKIIAHPANCKLMLHSENKIKHNKCDMSIKDLIEKIKTWDKKYTEQVTGFEPATNSLEG